MYVFISPSILSWADYTATWDTPPPKDSGLYRAFIAALRRYLSARRVIIPILGPAAQAKRDSCIHRPYKPPTEQPAVVVGGVSCIRPILDSLHVADVADAVETHALPGEPISSASQTSQATKDTAEWSSMDVDETL